MPGTAKPSERWTKAAEAAHQGVIAKLRILSMDIVMATSDGTDRQSMQSTSCLYYFFICMPEEASSCTAELIRSRCYTSYPPLRSTLSQFACTLRKEVTHIVYIHAIVSLFLEARFSPLQLL